MRLANLSDINGSQMETITSPVGKGAVNRPQDVVVVQKLLRENGFPALRVDGICGSNTLKAIIDYQKRLYHLPDGVVTPGRKMLQHLTQSASPPRGPQGATSTNRQGTRRQPRQILPSYRCLRLLMQYEQLRTLPYDDQTSTTIDSWTSGATIGYGHWISRKSDFAQYKEGISESDAEALFARDLKPFIATVRNYVKVDLTQNEFDALLIFAFNIGSRDDRHHTGFYYSTVLKIINGESGENLDNAWMRYTLSHGKPMRGLINRRKSELKVYHEGVYLKI